MGWAANDSDEVAYVGHTPRSTRRPHPTYRVDWARASDCHCCDAGRTRVAAAALAAAEVVEVVGAAVLDIAVVVVAVLAVAVVVVVDDIRKHSVPSR